MTESVQLKQFKRIQQTTLTQDCFDEIQYFPECGGIGIFIGTVRNHHEGKAVQALKYTSYAPVSEKMIRQIEQDIQQKYAVQYVRVIHRIGALKIGETAIIAIAYAAHRREAFAACEEAVERVKHEVPVWKEEFYTDGSSQYIAGCCIRKDYVDSSLIQSESLAETHLCERNHLHPDLFINHQSKNTKIHQNIHQCILENNPQPQIYPQSDSDITHQSYKKYPKITESNMAESGHHVNQHSNKI